VVMVAKFSVGRPDCDRPDRGDRSATFRPGLDTVGSQFDKVSCVDPIVGGSTSRSVVEVVVVTDVI